MNLLNVFSFNDADGMATMILRRVAGKFKYELIVSVIDASGFANESPAFAVNEALNFTRSFNAARQEIFYWQGSAEDEADKNQVYIWEFIPSPTKITPSTLEMFQMTVAQCAFEAENERPPNSDADLKKYLKSEGLHSEEPLKPKINQEEKSDKVIFKSDKAGFYKFDAATGLFESKCEAVTVSLCPTDRPFRFALKVHSASDNSLIHDQILDVDATQHLDRATFSFIWCHFTESGYIWTYSLRFAEITAVMAFANAYNQCVYEALNHEKWSKVSENDASFLLNPMLDVEMEHLKIESDSSDSDDSEDQTTSKSSRSASVRADSKFASGKNQLLSVGYRTDRSFVARGSAIGVFKPADDDDDDGLSFLTSSKLTAPDGKEFEASKMMLHREDRNLLLMSRDKPQSVFCMDLERGKVVEEWQIHDSSPITSMIPDSKYAQMTDQSTFIGLNANSLFRVDPRLAGNKRVDAEMKSYAVKNDFSCGATTGAGELAVASAKGEIRLFNKLDKRAKTLLPMFGDPILGIDVTESGKYILATCKTYLLLICTEIPDSQGQLGFTKSMGAEKPIPKRLQLKPEHIAYMGAQPSFTPARFSTGQSEEKSIITSSGPFVITWNMRRVKQGHLYDYQIKRYEDTVVADNFRYGQDRSIVVTLPEHVTMISKKSLSSPSPRLLKSDIVEEKW